MSDHPDLRSPSPARALVAPGPAVTLTVTEGPDRGKVFVCAGQGAFLVGRGSAAQLRLADAHVSRSQFLIELGPARCLLTELAGRNRTQLRNRPVAADSTVELHDGDVVRAGRTVLHVALAHPAPGPASEEETLALPGDDLPKTEPPDTQAYSGLTFPPPPVSPWIAGYRIERELGRGGMGVVYLALREADGARVALKTIVPAIKLAPAQVQRFIREANILRQLDHPHIVGFYEAGECDGVLFLAMNYVQGTDAARMLREQGPLPVKTAVRMTCHLLSALDYAHGKGMVHRDVKPANMLIEEVGKRTVKLADFGLARVYQESRLSGLTMEGDVGGTIAFMAPEQITGFRQVKPAADQYSAAATLYNLLTGQMLFDFGGSHTANLDKVLREPPVPILERRGDLPGRLAALVHQALAKEPDQRFPDVQTFRAALKPFASA
jgi:serine/threonine-protein kinase